LISGFGNRYPVSMDGLFPLVLLALRDQGIAGSLADFGILMASVSLAVINALVLVRQLIFAMLLGESG
jgi:hypothetical protein